MKEITKEWIEKAENDYQVVRHEMERSDTIYDAVCYHSQQCIEKYMKAIIVENDLEFDKSHDLDLLLKKCKDIIPELEEERDDIVKLSVYAIEIRYPGLSSSSEEAKETFEIMKKLRVILRNSFKLKD
jgi:HEPN domain-containing protein